MESFNSKFMSKIQILMKNRNIYLFPNTYKAYIMVIIIEMNIMEDILILLKKIQLQWKLWHIFIIQIIMIAG